MTDITPSPRALVDAESPAARNSLRLSAFLLTLVCIYASAGILAVDGIVNTRAGGDSPFLLQRVHQLAQALADGVFPVRWMPDAAFGLGYPFFTYYAALPYYLAAWLATLGLSLTTAIKLTQVGGLLAAAFAFFGFARRMLPVPAALCAAIAYTVTPFHLANVYIRGDSLSEFWAFVWMPLILWCIDSIQTRGPKAALMLGLSLSLAALVLTHNVSALLFAPFIVAWSLKAITVRFMASEPHSALAVAGGLLLAAALALGLSAWFWWPALAESAQVQLGDQTGGFFNFRNHFRSLEICALAWLQSSCAGRPIDQIALIQPTFFALRDPLPAFALGLIQTLGLILGTVAITVFRKRNSALRLPLVLCLAATLMMMQLSTPLWSLVPALQLAQFPWRFLTVQTVFGSLVIGAIGLGAARARLLLSAVCVLLVLSIAPLVFDISSLRVNRDTVNPRTLQIFEWYSGIIGSTIRSEYMPATVQPIPAVGPDLLGQPRQALIAQDGTPASALQSELLISESDTQLWRVNNTSSAPIEITLPLLHSPAWSARDSAALVETRAYAGSGWIAMTARPGEQRIQFTHSGTAVQQRAEAISAAVALGIASAGAVLLWRNRRRRLTQAVAMRVSAVLVCVLALAIGARLLDRKAYVLGAAEFVDFNTQPFPSDAPATFSPPITVSMPGPAMLIGARIEPRTILAGQQFTLTLTWANANRAPLVLIQELPSASPRFELFRHARSSTSVSDDISVHTVLTNALPGPLLLALIPDRGWTSTSNAAYVFGKQTEGLTLLGPTVTGTPRNAPTSALLQLANGLRAHDADWLMPDGQRICFRAAWSRAGAVNRADALQVSYKLYGADNVLLAQADGQPQQGLAPTWSWQDDVVVNDSRCVFLTNAARPPQPAELVRLAISWYRLRDFSVTGQGELYGNVDPTPGAVNRLHAEHKTTP